MLAQQNIEHSYPHCWRCHNATIFRATEQWFIGMERNHLRQRALDAINTVKWLPEWGEERIVKHDRDAPGLVHLAAARLGRADRGVLLREVPRAADRPAHSRRAWCARFAQADAPTSGTPRPPADLIPADAACAKCGSTEFTKESDILDVWFDSGSSHLAVLTEANDLPWPSDMYLEGGDQYRGWFHSSLLIGVGLRNHSPYRG